MSLDAGGNAPATGWSVYDAGLPRKRMAAGVLFVDGAGQVLLVDPVYKDRWEIPGGTVEAEESPRKAARREVYEELGLDREPGQLLGIDWVSPREGRSEGLMTIFDGGVLGPEEIAAIRLPAHELRAHAFVDEAAVGEVLSPLLSRRVTACLAARSVGAASVYLEDGFPM